jgi:hypothetical protein
MRKYAFASTLAFVGIPALAFSIVMLLRSYGPVECADAHQCVERIMTGPGLDEAIDGMNRNAKIIPTAADGVHDPE